MRLVEMNKKSPISPKAAILVLLLLIAGCPRNHPPDTPPTPTGPTSGHPDSVYPYATVPTDPDGNDVSVRFSWGDGDTSTWTDPASSGDTLFVSHAWDSLGSFSVTAQARDLKEAMSPWSDALQVTIVPATRAPSSPTPPIGRRNGHVGTMYEFESMAFDPDEDSVAVQFSWGDGDTSVWSEFDTSGALVKMGHTWAAAGTTFVTARAKDVHGALSEWSQKASLVLVEGNREPEVPGPPLGNPDFFADSTGALGAVTTDPDNDLVQYRFAWGDGDTSGWTQLVGSGVRATGYHTWVEVDSYFVRVQARDELGSTTDWSEGRWVYADPSYPCRVVGGISMPGNPEAPAVLPDGEYIYVPLDDSGLTAVLRTSDNAVVAKVPVGGMPHAAEALPAGDKVYVANYEDHTVSVIRTSDNTVVKTIAVGRRPWAIEALPDGKRVYVCNSQDTLVSVIDANLDSVVGTVRTAKQPCCAAVLPSGEYLFVGCGWSGRVQKVWVGIDSVVATTRVQAPHGMVALPNGELLYVTDRGSPDRIVVLRAADNSILATIDFAGSTDPEGVVVLPDGAYVYVANTWYQEVVVVRTRDNEIIRKLHFGAWVEDLAVSPAGENVYVTLPDADSIAVLGY